MKEFEWTRDSAYEFAAKYKNGELGTNLPTAIMEFEQSKQPAKEWEVVEYEHENRAHRPTMDCGCPIKSIRRLADGEVFSLGDNLQISANKIMPIKSFQNEGGLMFVAYSDGNIGTHSIQLSACVKAKRTPLFTTADGVEVFDGEVWVLFVEETLHRPAWSIDKFKAENCTTNGGGILKFNDRAKADEYVLMNKPCLSVNEILNSVENINGLSFHNKLIELSKQKQQ